MKLITDPLARPKDAAIDRAAFVAAVAELCHALDECENLPQRVTDAMAGVSKAACVLGGYVGPPL